MSGGGKLFIKVKTDNNKHIITEVTDTGCGIPKENINKVFDPFFTTKLDKKGTGLGLSVVYSIIQRHNGNIEVTSKVGEGTTFTIKFPINDTKEN
jgi:two-component system NtrC family sensor kinase